MSKTMVMTVVMALVTRMVELTANSLNGTCRDTVSLAMILSVSKYSIRSQAPVVLSYASGWLYWKTRELGVPVV